jgi:predicted dienelactone hydrolase
MAAVAATTFAVPPLPPGPYPVACSNVTQDFGRLLPGEDVQAYWEGLARTDGTPRYATDLLSDAANTLAVTVIAPNDSDLYGSFAGHAVQDVVLVCHPTAAADPRPDYALPTGRVVPHMQRGADAPLWPDATSRFPVLLFSHGYGGSPISSDYIAAVRVFASYGYVVAAPFHGDFRISDLSLDDFGDVVQIATHLKDFLALQALRPLSMSATIDLLLAHPHWRDRVDAGRIGAFGASLGGETVMLMAGAGMTTSFGLSWTQVTNDPRLKAAVGYVPYFGQVFFPAFGRDQHGLDGIALPYLAISGTADTTAPIAATIEGIGRLSGPRELVALEGVQHGFDVPSTNDIFTWSVTFLDAHVRGDPQARARLTRMASVEGGGDDFVVIPYNVPPPPNYGGLWWNAPAFSESGWGLNIAHQGDTLFVSWFTYDVDGSPLWMVVAANPTAPNVYEGVLYRATGPAFNAMPFDPALVIGTPVGMATFTFTGSDNATFTYTVGNGPPQTKNITREVLAFPVPTCTWGAQPDLALASRFQDLWWAAPAGIESGWGINLTHQGDIIFGTWFTYGIDGKPLWLVVAAEKTAPNAYSGKLFTATGPPFNVEPFDPAKVIATEVGTASFTFADGNHADFDYTVNGARQVKAITREVFVPPGTVCE